MPVVILDDTCDSSRIIDIASGADVVVHEAPLENELMAQCIDHGHSAPGSYFWQQLYSRCKSTSPWKVFPEIRTAWVGSEKICHGLQPQLVIGANLLGLIFPFVSVFSLTCHRVPFFALRYFVNYAPLLRAVCELSYLVCCLAPFYSRAMLTN